MITVDIVYERSPTIGNGHYMRSRVLLNYLNSNGIKARHVEESKFEQSDSDILIIDVSDTKKLEQLIDSSNQFVATIEYYGNASAPDLNVNVFEHFEGDRSYESNTSLDYAFIRDSFKEWRDQTLDREYLLIMIGANPTEKDLNECLRFCSAIPIPYRGIKIILNNYSDLVIDEKGVEIIKTPDNIEEIMANCKLAITSPGVATLELMYLGKPSFLYSLNSRQENAATYMIERNLSLGSIESEDYNNFDLVRQSIRDAVDGNGCKRIWDLIHARYEEKMDRGNSQW